MNGAANTATGNQNGIVKNAIPHAIFFIGSGTRNAEIIARTDAARLLLATIERIKILVLAHTEFVQCCAPRKLFGVFVDLPQINRRRVSVDKDVPGCHGHSPLRFDEVIVIHKLPGCKEFL